MPEIRWGMKRVDACDVDAGDIVYQTSNANDTTVPPGLYMMHVMEIGRGDYEGIDVFLLRGNVYALTGEGAGPEGAFLGEVTPSRLLGAAEWYLAVDGTIVKRCPLDEGGEPAEWGFDTME